jgi:PAS domain S-box-containing protein
VFEYNYIILTLLTAQLSLDHVPAWLTDWATVLGGLTALGAMATFLFNKFLKFCKSIKSTAEKIAIISAELRPNGGSSVKDAIKRIETGLKDNADAIQVVTSNLEIAKSENEELTTKTLAAISRVEDAAYVADKKREALLLDSEFGMWESDAKGSCLWVNRTLSRKLGLTRDDLLGRGWFNAIAPEDLDSVGRSWITSIQAGIEFELTYSYINGLTGDRVPVHVRANKVVNADDKIIGWIGIGEFL